MGGCLYLKPTSVNPVHNAPRLSVTGLDVQADQARHGGWGKERSITDRPGPALSDLDRPGPAWGVGEGEVCYRQTWPSTPGFRPTGPGVGRGGGRGLLQTDPAQHYRISTDPARHSRISTDRARCGGWGRERSITDRPGPIFRPLVHQPLPSPTPKTSVTDTEAY
jgi:hypothetical protein